MAVDTACSSSLVATHQAVSGLQRGDADLALAGGVNIILSGRLLEFRANAGMLSPDGQCKTFDASANGYVRGEGCGILVLKRLAEAEADGDRIWGVIRGTALNQDGASPGLTVPNGAAQERVIRAALRRAGVQPSAIDYLEAHGTGTEVGDPIEIDATAAVYGRDRDASRPLLIGSVKTNIGHLESAAGVAGLIKTVLAMNRGVIPRHLHFRNPNPEMDWERMPLQVTSAPTPWPTHADRPPLAGVSGFGWSGTNAHVVLQGYGAPNGAEWTTGAARPVAVSLPASVAEPAQAAGGLAPRGTRMLPLSGKTGNALRAQAAGLSHLARRAGVDPRGRRRGVRSAAFRHGVVGWHRPEPFRAPRRRGVPRRGLVARRPDGARGRRGREGLGGGCAHRDEGGLRLHRAGEPVGRHGRGTLRERTGGPRGAGPLRSGARRGSGHLAARRDVWATRCGGRAGRSAVEAAGHLCARVRARGALGKRRDQAGRGPRPQLGRDRGRADGRRVQPGGGASLRCSAGCVAGRASRRGCDGGGLRAALPRGRGRGRAERRLRRAGPERRGRQRRPPGGERPQGGSGGVARSLRGGGGPRRAAAQEPGLPQRHDRAGSGRSRSRDLDHPLRAAVAYLRQQPDRPDAGTRRGAGCGLLAPPDAREGGLPRLRRDPSRDGRRCRHRDRPPCRAGADDDHGLADGQRDAACGDVEPGSAGER